MPVDEVNGAALHWERSGSGPRLLFCNGSGSTLTDAEPMLIGLANSFDVLAWDYRGFGASAPPSGPYTMSDLAADAAGLLDLTGWDSCSVLGVSFGGMVAQEFAVSHPGRVQRLALACTSAGGGGGSSYALQDLFDLAPSERTAAGLRLADSRWDQRWLDQHPLDRLLAERFAAGRDQPDPTAAHTAQLEARERHDVWDRLGAVDCPTLIACGGYDGIAPAANSRAIASRISGAELREYRGGHAFLFQDPVAMGELLAFLGEGEGQRAG